MSAEVLQDNEGTRTVQVSDRDGLVIMHFERPVRWCALDPVTGRQFAEVFAKACYKALAGDTPTPMARTQLVDQIRARLVSRVALMIRSFEARAPRPDPKVQATEIVDQVMKEVT